MYLSGGTCVALIMIGGGTMKLFFEIVCADTCKMNPLSTIEWYLVFTCCAIIIAQLPNLNSIAGVSLVGAITAISFCTLIWVLSISRGRPGGVSYEPPKAKSDVARGCSVLNAIGVIAFAFRGHNVVLEIQVGDPTNSFDVSLYRVRSENVLTQSFSGSAGDHAFESAKAISKSNVGRSEIRLSSNRNVFVSPCRGRLLGIWRSGNH